MVRFAQDEDIDQLKELWKICFGDSNEYIDLIFSTKFVPQNTLIHYTDNKVVASLHMQPYRIRLYNHVIPFYYLAGLSTHPQYQNRGYMKQLIEKSFDIMSERKIPLSILVPAEEWLFGYYNKFGFEQTFEKGTKEIELKRIVQNSKSTKEAFDIFDREYQQEDFCVLKTIDDFKIIIDDFIADDCPPKYNLRAMSAIVDLDTIIELYAQSQPQAEFVLETNSLQASETIRYYISEGKVSILDTNIDSQCSILKIDLQSLTKLLFGTIPDDLKKDEYKTLFQEHHPIINLMLE